MTDKQIIIEDCPHFIGGCCQEYLDGVCENHKCDLKIIRELEQKLKAKEQECEELRTERKNLKWDLENNIQVKNHAMEEINQLKQTLTEIKEIAERGFKHSQCNCGAKADLDLLLQKISEVEE